MAARSISAEVSHLGPAHSAAVAAKIHLVHPEGGIAIAFMRAHTLFHCYTIVAAPHNGLHRYQFALKNHFAVEAVSERIKSGGVVNVLCGPVRHAVVHNVAFYFHDHYGNIVEYSSEEEIVLDAAGRTAQEWSALNLVVGDEWGAAPPEIFFA